MCGMNLAFDREVIGPAMYFGLMGEGQPWGRYDGEAWVQALHEDVTTLSVLTYCLSTYLFLWHADMWAGWCVKKVR
jgi:hypothetical protein